MAWVGLGARIWCLMVLNWRRPMGGAHSYTMAMAGQLMPAFFAGDICGGALHDCQPADGHQAKEYFQVHAVV